MEEFLTTKFGLSIDTRSSIDNTLHGSGRTVEKGGILLQIEKVPEISNGDLICCLFCLEDAVAHLSVTDPSSTLTIEKSGHPEVQGSTKETLSLSVSCNFMTLKKVFKILVVSLLIDPFFVDCITFLQDASADPTSKF